MRTASYQKLNFDLKMIKRLMHNALKTLRLFLFILLFIPSLSNKALCSDDIQYYELLVKTKVDMSNFFKNELVLDSNDRVVQFLNRISDKCEILTIEPVFKGMVQKINEDKKGNIFKAGLFTNVFSQTNTLDSGIENLSRIYKVKVSSTSDIKSLIDELSSHKKIEYVEPNYLLTENDLKKDIKNENNKEYLNSITQLNKLYKDNALTIALINDSGADEESSLGNDIDDNNGYSFYRYSYDLEQEKRSILKYPDMLVGLVANIVDKSFKMLSLLKKINVLSIKTAYASDQNGMFASNMAEAIYYAIEREVDVIKLSHNFDIKLSDDPEFKVIKEVVKYATEKGIVVIEDDSMENIDVAKLDLEHDFLAN